MHPMPTSMWQVLLDPTKVWYSVSLFGHQRSALHHSPTARVTSSITILSCADSFFLGLCNVLISL